MSGKLRVGLLGTGFIQDQFHIPVYRELPNVDVTAVAGRDRAKTEAFAAKWGIGEVYSGDEGISKLCQSPNVDVVDIGISNDRHLAAIQQAAENHKHVICEKPLARDAKEAREALQVAERYGVFHCYAENQVFMPQVQRAQRFIRDGSIGTVTWVRSREAHSGPHMEWFWDPRQAGGGVLIDMGCHSIELTRRLIGKKPIDVCGWTATLAHKAASVEDNSLVLIRYEGGTLAQNENSWSARGGLDLRYEVYGTDGSIFVDVARETGIKVFTTGQKEGAGYIVEKADASSGWMYPAWDERVTYGFVNELRHFTDSISRGVKAEETFEDGVVVSTLIDAAYESSRTSRWVPV
jgi:predicted dehydrogenase